MYEPQDPRPLDPPEAFDLPDGKEEWVAEKAMEVRGDFKLMKAALEWDGEQTGSDDLYEALAIWMNAHSFFDEQVRETAVKSLRICCQELAERYAEFVLFPAMLEGLKNG